MLRSSTQEPRKQAGAFALPGSSLLNPTLSMLAADGFSGLGLEAPLSHFLPPNCPEDQEGTAVHGPLLATQLPPGEPSFLLPAHQP